MKRLALTLLVLAALPAQAQQIFNNTNTTIVTLNTNTNVTLTPSGTVLTVRSADANPARILSQSAGASVASYLSCQHARGTVASPTATQSGDNVCIIGGFSYGASAYSGSEIGFIAITANQNQSNTARGSRIDINTTPDGSTTAANVIRFGNDAGILVPSTVTGGSQGAGTINAQGGLFVAGTSVRDAAILTSGTLGVARGGTGTGTAFTTGSVPFAGASGVYTQDNANFFWDNTNKRIGIGNAAPAQVIHAKSAGNTYFRAETNSAGGQVGFELLNTTGNTTALFKNAATDDFNFFHVGATRLKISTTGDISAENTTASTSTTTGALISKGGIGVAGALYAGSEVTTGVTTVASLPTCNAAHKAARHFVTDSNAASFTAGIGAVVAAGGTTQVPVVCDGTNWRIG